MEIIGVIAAVVGSYFTYKAYVRSKGDNPKKDKKKYKRSTHSLTFANYKQWFTNNIAFVDIRGIKSQRKVHMSAIRIPVNAIYTNPKVKTGLSDWDLDATNYDLLTPKKLKTVQETTRRLLITGEPGAGKTSFLKYIGWVNLDKLKYPLFIELPIFSNYLSKINKSKEAFELDRILIDFVVIECKKNGFEFLEEDLLEQIEKNNIILLFDNFDGINSKQEKKEMSLFLSQISTKWSKIEFVLTSRTSGIDFHIQPLDYKIVSISPFDNKEVENFLKKWAAVLFNEKNIKVREEFVDDLISTIYQSPHLIPIAKNAMMLTSLAVLYYNDKTLPVNKANILDAVIRWLIESKKEGDYSEFDSESKYNVYSHLALKLFKKRDTIENRFDKKEVREYINNFFPDEISTSKFIENEIQLTGLLVQKDENTLGFWHSSFFEYLVALEISNQTDDHKSGWWSIIKNHFNDHNWKEIISFIPFCLNRLGHKRVNLFFNPIISFAFINSFSLVAASPYVPSSPPVRSHITISLLMFFK